MESATPFSGDMTAEAESPGFTACSGCSLCLLVCPVWRQTQDVMLTPHGRAKALQHGASLQEIAASLDTCTLCGACDPVCPENLSPARLALEWRRRGATRIPLAVRQARLDGLAPPPRMVPQAAENVLLLTDPSWRKRPDLLARIGSGLGAAPGQDGTIAWGARVALALASGIPLAPRVVQEGLTALRRVRHLIVDDAVLAQWIREQLPGLGVIGLGEALSRVVSVRRGLRPDDLYVIEPRAYHGEYARLVLHYERLRAECGCAFNLDLQRMAVPPDSHGLPYRLGIQDDLDENMAVHWVLLGHRARRIVIEHESDRSVFERVTDIPVVHLADCAVWEKEAC